VEIIKILIPSG